MKRILSLLTAALIVTVLLIIAAAPAMAQSTLVVEKDLPKSGGLPSNGPVVILPTAAVLLLGSGILAYAVLRRTR